MLNINHTMPPDFYEYEDNLRADMEVYLAKGKTLKNMRVLSSEYFTAERLLQSYMKFYSQNSIRFADRKGIIKFLTEYENVSPRSLQFYDYKSQTKKESLDMEKVLKPLMASGRAVDFLQLYMNMKQTDRQANELRALYNRASETTLTDMNGQELMAISYDVEKQSTGRFYTKNENILGVSLKNVVNFTVPEGHFLYWADFGQLDLRVAYHTILREDNPEVDTIFQSVEDKYEAFARILSTKIGIEFDLDKFKEARGHYKVGVLARTYGAGTETLKRDISDSQFISQLHQYFLNNQTYQKYLEEIEKVIGYEVEMEIEDYFGVKRSISDINKETTRKALNSPIQSTSNSIVMHYVNATVKRFRDAGFGEDKFRVYMVRHDEPVFMIHTDCLPYIWILEDHKTVQVDDWAPLTMDHHLGFNYKMESELLMGAYENICKENENNMTPKVTHKRRPNYMPVKKTASVHMVETAQRVVAYIEGFEGQLVEIASVSYEGVGEAVAFDKALGQAFSVCVPRGYKYFGIYTEKMSGASYYPDLDVYYKYVNAMSYKHEQAMDMVESTGEKAKRRHKFVGTEDPFSDIDMGSANNLL